MPPAAAAPASAGCTCRGAAAVGERNKGGRDRREMFRRSRVHACGAGALCWRMPCQPVACHGAAAAPAPNWAPAVAPALPGRLPRLQTAAARCGAKGWPCAAPPPMRRRCRHPPPPRPPPHRPTCLARSSSSLIWLLTSTPFSSATCRTCGGFRAGTGSRSARRRRRRRPSPHRVVVRPGRPPGPRTSLMRLSSSTRGFSKSRTVVLDAFSLTGPKRDRMDCSHSRPPWRTSRGLGTSGGSALPLARA